jgi:hypothetical protein
MLDSGVEIGLPADFYSGDIPKVAGIRVGVVGQSE